MQKQRVAEECGSSAEAPRKQKLHPGKARELRSGTLGSGSGSGIARERRSGTFGNGAREARGNTHITHMRQKARLAKVRRSSAEAPRKQAQGGQKVVSAERKTVIYTYIYI